MQKKKILGEEIKQTPNFYSMGQNAVKSDFSIVDEILYLQAERSLSES